jgi:poly-beta-1,6-N-acetyl-D-glucosamine synthase
MSSAEIVFWASAAVAVYVYFGFPVVLVFLANVFGRPPRKQPVTPSVSLLIAAYNEAAVIEAKVRNARDLDYPPELLEIAVASDGSKDRTGELARIAASGDPRVRVFEYPVNRGKIIALNETVPHLHGEILVFSDAASMLVPGALRHLAEHFADPRIGAVSGLYRVLKSEGSQIGSQEGFYWKYETFLKAQEARIGSILGAHGALYAIRRKLYPFPAPGTINDDYVIPLRIVQQGYRVSYEPAAVAYEEAAQMDGFARRVRIMAGNFQQLGEIRRLLWPPRLLTLFFFLSHKAGRLVVPFCMVLMAASTLPLLPRPLYLVLGCLQLLFYALALLGAAGDLRPRLLRLPYYFCMINTAAFWALFRRRAAWK